MFFCALCLLSAKILVVPETIVWLFAWVQAGRHGLFLVQILCDANVPVAREKKGRGGGHQNQKLHLLMKNI